MEAQASGSLKLLLLEWTEFAALGIELLAVTIILISTIVSTAIFLRGFIKGESRLAIYEAYKVQLGRGLLLGLELLVAADIVLTVVLKPTLANVAVLGILVLIRTFLSWSIVVEIEHRWPWQQASQHNKSESKA